MLTRYSPKLGRIAAAAASADVAAANAAHGCKPSIAASGFPAMSERDVRALPIWTGDIRIELLSGGLTNVNYRVESGGEVFAVRIGTDNATLGIDRRNELACTQFAARRGLAPRVAYSAPGVLVSVFVDGTPLTTTLVRDRLDRCAATLRAIHEAGTMVTGHLQYFSAFQVVRTYLATATRRCLDLPDNIGTPALRNEIDELATRVGPFMPTFCHNDFMPGNLIDAGDRLWVIDWEYAGIGHPLFDLAGLASNCDLDASQDRALLSAYDGRLDPARHAEFKVLKAMAALRESLWAVLQGAQSTIDFDFDGYRDDNYRKYRAYRNAAG